jgi:nitrous oxidase accessory protein NosD
MKLSISILVLALLFVPAHPASAGQGGQQNVVTLTAGQVTDAVGIEAAIQSATARGTRPGTVILDGQEGAFVYSGDDRSINIFVSNLTLRGVNGAVIEGCADGLFFDELRDVPVQHILVEGIAFRCLGGGVEASGSYPDVTLRDNLFQVGATGIDVTVSWSGASSGWLITGNLIQAGGDGIILKGAQKVTVANNHLAGLTGISMWGTTGIKVQHNAIQAGITGVQLAQEAWDNLVQGNTILGVSAAGIVLEPGVAGNRILANRVLCAAGSQCLTVSASPEVAELNKICGNRP